METGRSQKLRPELFPPLSGCASKRSRNGEFVRLEQLSGISFEL
jgi:hypothetical protein